MCYDVVFAPAARDDLDDLYAYIRDHGSARAAERYVGRIWAFCRQFEQFPEQGTRRDNLRPGLRTIGFQRRVTIAFAIIDKRVVILRILYGGRDIGGALAEGGDTP